MKRDVENSICAEILGERLWRDVFQLTAFK